MKILHILDHSIPLHSGYTFRTRAILKQQRVLGWQTFHVTSAKHTGARQEIEEVDELRFYRTPQTIGLLAALPIINQWLIVKSLQKRLDEVIAEIQPDILHAHSPALNGLAALHAGKKHNIPVVYECRAFWEDAAVDHGTTKEKSLRYRITHALETRVFKRANAITTICEGLRKDIMRRNIAENKITVIPNAVDIEKFSDSQETNPELKHKLGIQDKIVLGFIGSFYAYEGIPLILQALPEVLKQQPNVRVLLVGGGPQEQLIKEKVKQLKLDDYVIFTGRVPHDMVQDYYKLVDIFIYPRLAMRLTDLVTPLKPLEAMAQGRLVIASDVGGHKELIKDQKNGVLFKANDVNSLAACTLNLIGRPELWEKMRQAGRLYVEQERNWKKSVGKYQNVYSQLLLKL